MLDFKFTKPTDHVSTSKNGETSTNLALKQRSMATERPGSLARTFGNEESKLRDSLTDALTKTISNSARLPKNGSLLYCQGSVVDRSMNTE